jgi:hypothetical protein
LAGFRSRWPALEPCGQLLAFDQLEHQKRLALRLLETVNGGDARVVERGEKVRLALEARETLGLAGLRRQHLDGDVTTELGVARAIDFAHAPGAQRAANLIGAETHAGSEGHGAPLKG